MGTPAERDETPPVWQWMAQQHNNTDPERAAAARYVSERWQFGPWYNHRKVLSTLQAEESEYLYGFQLLTEDFVDLFDIGVREQLEDHRLGVVSPLVPVGREQCGHHFSSGRQCKRDSVPGAGLCSHHGGSWINESERAEVVGKVSAKLVDIGERAVAVISDLMDNAKSEKVRGDMAIAVLDRIGVGPVTKVELDITDAAETAAERVRARLVEIQRRKALEAAPEGESGDIVDAELVPEPESEPDA